MNNNLPYLEHYIIEVQDLPKDILLSEEKIKPFILKFIESTGLKVVEEEHHNFEPFGTTLIFILSSSHLSIHTWPEFNYLHMDLLTCSKLEQDFIIDVLEKKIFLGQKIKLRKILYEN